MTPSATTAPDSGASDAHPTNTAIAASVPSQLPMISLRGSGRRSDLGSEQSAETPKSLRTPAVTFMKKAIKVMTSPWQVALQFAGRRASTRICVQEKQMPPKDREEDPARLIRVQEVGQSAQSVRRAFPSGGLPMRPSLAYASPQSPSCHRLSNL